MGDKAWRASSNGPDWKDVQRHLIQFEEHNGVQVVIGFGTVREGRKQEVKAHACAFEMIAGLMAPMPSACVSVTCSGTNLRTLEAVVIHLLYMLDGQLARIEMPGAGIK